VKTGRTGEQLLGILWAGAVTLPFLPQAYRAFAPLQDLMLVAGGSLVCLLTACRTSSGGAKGAPGWPLWGAAAAVFLMIVAPWPGAASPARHLSEAIRLGALCGIALTLPLLIGAESRRFLLRAWLVIGWLQAALVFLQLGGLDPFAAFVGPALVWRVYGTLGNPNLVAVLLLPLAVLSLDHTLLAKRRHRLLSVVILSLALCATGSRLATLLLVLGLGLAMGHLHLAAATTKARGRPMLWAGLLLLLGAAMSAAFLMGKNFNSPWGRLFFWRAALLLFYRQPLQGHGLGHFQGAYPQAAGEIAAPGAAPLALPVHAHNDWLEYAVEGGAASFLLVASIVAALWAGWQTPDKRPLVLALGLMFLAACWYSPLHTAPTALLFWTLFGLVAAVQGEGTKRRIPRLLPAGLCLIMLLGVGPMAKGVYGHLLAGRAEAAYAQGAIKEGVGLWARAVQLAPGEGAFVYGWAWGLARTGEEGKALGLAQDAAHIHANFDLYLLQITLLARQRRLAEARAHLTWLTTVFPDLQEAQLLLPALEVRPQHLSGGVL